MSAGLGLAVVGYGQTAGIHTRIMTGEGHRLLWSIGRLPERTEVFARDHGYQRHCADLRHALEDPEVEAVLLCTPSPMHAQQAEQCLRAGKHVLVEIPLAMSYADGVRLDALAEATGRTLMVAHGHRYQPAMRAVRELIATGRLDPRQVLARYFLLRQTNVGSNGYVRSWTDNLLWHHGQHSVDLVLWLLGIDEPGRVDVSATLARPDAELGIPMDISLTMRTPQDQVATVAMSYHSRVSVYDYTLIARDRTLVIENGVLRDQDGVLGDLGPNESWRLQDREFAAACREGRRAAISAASVLPALDVLQRAQDQHEAALARGAV